MKVHAVGIVHMKGISKATGRPYDFVQLKVLMPIEVMASEKMAKMGYGCEVTDVDVDPEAFAKFASIQFPAHLALMFAQKLTRNGMQSVVSDFRQLAVADPLSGHQIKVA